MRLSIRCFALSTSLLVAAACLAAPPPISVDTDFGEVRADRDHDAQAVAELLADMAPEIQAILPGVQLRRVDVWVQERLRLYRWQERTESVRGFTLLEREFDATRIHLRGGGQSSWYLAHELVHALIDRSWRPLPALLEEGLADVVAEELNPEFAAHIRAHRLFNVSLLTGGMIFRVRWNEPDEGPPRSWRRRTATSRVLLPPDESEPLNGDFRTTLVELLSADRAGLHARFHELPESYYGLAWFLVARIVERRGLDGLHRMCLDATAAGQDLIPIDTILAAADVTLDSLDAQLVGDSFRYSELRAAAYLRTELFSDLTVSLLRPHFPAATSKRLLWRVSPAFVTLRGDEVPFRTIRPLYESIRRDWSLTPR
ncbi:MAG: hypothetical protein WD226_11585 [Planctomycetota bacterium]